MRRLIHEPKVRLPSAFDVAFLRSRKHGSMLSDCVQSIDLLERLVYTVKDVNALLDFPEVRRFGFHGIAVLEPGDPGVLPAVDGHRLARLTTFVTVSAWMFFSLIVGVGYVKRSFSISMKTSRSRTWSIRPRLSSAL